MRNQWSFGRVLVLLLCLSLNLVACVQPPVGMTPVLNANSRLAKLTGSWQVETTVVQQAVTFPALFTFTSDGILITDEPPTPFETSGHGNWVATGPATADFTFLALIGSEAGALSATLKVGGSLHYEGSNDTWAAPFTIQVTDATGTEILADQGTFKGTRIVVEQAGVTAQALKPGDTSGDLRVTQGPAPFDLTIPHYGAFCNANPMIEPDSTVAKPGTYTVECSMPPLPKMFIAFGLTARTTELLDDIWGASDADLYLNNQLIDQSAFGSLDADVPVTGMPGQDPNQVLTLKARVWNVILENITPGEFTLRLVWHVSQEVFDGDVTSPAGDYDITYKITVDAALAVEEGTPAPVELIRQPVEFVRKIDTSAQKIQNSASLAVDSQGNVYVTDSSDTPRVLKYDSQGNFVLTWGEAGNGEGQFTFIPPNPDAGPTAGFVAVDAEDNVYVSDAYNFRVQKFDANGNFLMQFGSKGAGDGQFDEPTAGPIYVDSQGNIYVSTFPRVQKFDAAGNFLATYGTAGTADGQFNGAALGSIDREGNLYVADFLSARVQKLDASGQFLLKWGSAGTEAGQFTSPVTIGQDKAGKLYVADNSDRIQIFDTDGNFLGQWRETGGGNPPLTGAIAALAIDSDDNIYVSDASPSIYVFHPR